MRFNDICSYKNTTGKYVPFNVSKLLNVHDQIISRRSEVNDVNCILKISNNNFIGANLRTFRTLEDKIY